MMIASSNVTTQVTSLLSHDDMAVVLAAVGAHKLGALRTVRPHVFPHTLRFCAPRALS
ncbi:MAG: hypothetical protein VST68_06680 [Nitrospirota bacterium]|nr:hypothetical protein [Nitrospirota bacterium]